MCILNPIISSLLVCSQSDVTSETSSTHSAGSDSTKGEGSGGVASKKKFMSRKGRKDKKKDANTSSNVGSSNRIS